MANYTDKERKDIWTAFDNIQSALSIIRDYIEDGMDKEDLEWLNTCIKTVHDML